MSLYCRITADPIDSLALMRHVRRDVDGAVILFTGVVRNHDGGRRVTGLRYEAYEAMATGKISEICEVVRGQFAVSDIAVVHRTGDLEVGDISVAIAVAAPHRDEAYKASREVIERLKREVPIWKRERYADGEEVWLEGAAPRPSKAD